MIDWTRVALPQTDGYDTGIILQFAGRQENNIFGKFECSEGVRAFDDSIFVSYITQDNMRLPRYKNAALKHPNIEASKRYLKSWPDIYTQIKRLIKVLHPLCDTSIQEEYKELAVGSTSYSDGLPSGYVCTTVDDPLGLAIALVHETAHHKLRSLGIFEDYAERLITNGKEELFLSPGDYRKKTLVSAVYHDLYTYAHILYLCLKLLESSLDDAIGNCVYQLMTKNFIRVEFAYSQLTKKLKTDKDGELFVGSFMKWVECIINESIRVLRGSEYAINIKLYQER